jgi:hypothetical protein
MVRGFEAAIYGKPRQRECGAVAEGLTALGAAVRWRSAGYFTDDDVFDDVDCVVTFGQRLHSKTVASTYRERGVPVITIDLPPLRIDDFESTHRAMWLDHVNWMPEHPCPADRLMNLKLKINERREDGSGVLVAGQAQDDAAHGMGAVALREWAKSTANAVGDFYPVTWRPHPQYSFKLNGFQVSDEPIDEALEKDWRAVVTYNSTVGLAALLAGIPVFCDPSSFYAELCGTSLAGLAAPRFPTIGRMTRFFSRLAYVMWTFDEIESGKPIEFILKQIEGRHNGVDD